MSHSPAKHTTDELKDSAVAVKDAMIDMASEAKHFASDRIGEARDSASAMIDSVKSKAEDYNDSVVGFIRKNPYKSLAVAAGVGLALGYMLRRR